MKTYSKTIAKLTTLGVLLTVFGINAHANDVRERGAITGEVVATDFDSRRIVLEQYPAEIRYRVALGASISLLQGSKGALEDVLLGDIVSVKLDGNTGDIRDLAVVAKQ